MWSLNNCKAAHGAPGNPCVTCSAKAGRPVYCNQLRSYGSADRARRIIAALIEANSGNGNPPGTGNARRPSRPEPDKSAGRQWLGPVTA